MREKYSFYETFDMLVAKAKVDAGFEFMKKLGIEPEFQYTKLY